MKKLFIFLIIGILSYFKVYSQSTDFGGILEVDFEKNLRKSFEISFEEEIKFNHCLTQYDRFKSVVNANYLFFNKHFKAGISFEYINKMNDDRVFQNRYRINVGIGYYEKIRQFRFNYRVKFQNTFKDELRGEYRINPEMYLRNKAEVGYVFINKPIKLSLSTEFFWRINNPGQNIIDNIRTIAAVDYRLKKQHTLTFFVRADNEVQVNNPENIYYLGIVYKLKP
jgi:hypothetical protein